MLFGMRGGDHRSRIGNSKEWNSGSQKRKESLEWSWGESTKIHRGQIGERLRRGLCFD